MSASLRQLLREEIVCHGPISFARFMERALYEPELGYYARSSHRTGKTGDFITSVSIGPCYGQLLASQIAETWRKLGQPTPWHLVEQGANDGQLMQDINAWLRHEHPDCAAATQCHFIEPLDTARASQAIRIPHAQWHATIPSRLGSHGIFFCNELLDAFPIQRFQHLGQGQWAEMCVGYDLTCDTFLWTHSSTKSAVPHPQSPIPMGFIYESCPSLPHWTTQISQLFDHGLWIITDYGLNHEEFFASARAQGTLRGYCQHQLISDDFLAHPGEIDLTAHVNWTHLVDASQQQGLKVLTFNDQARFLTPLAIPFLQRIERTAPPTPADLRWLRQFQTLTHPAQLGAKFQTLLLQKGESR